MPNHAVNRSGEVGRIGNGQSLVAARLSPSRDRLTIQGTEGDEFMRLAISFVASDETFIGLRKILKMMVQELATDT